MGYDAVTSETRVLPCPAYEKQHCPIVLPLELDTDQSIDPWKKSTQGRHDY